MSFTVFFALCILAADFLVYFFLKLTYGEKNRVGPRRLPPEYYSETRSSRGSGRPALSGTRKPYLVQR
jgi:hypothetical protein